MILRQEPGSSSIPLFYHQKSRYLHFSGFQIYVGKRILGQVPGLVQRTHWMEHQKPHPYLLLFLLVQLLQDYFRLGYLQSISDALEGSQVAFLIKRLIQEVVWSEILQVAHLFPLGDP